MCLKLKTIKTNRLVLREWSMDDVEDLYDYASVPGVGEAAGWEHHESIEESRDFLEMLIGFKTVYAIEMNGRAIGSFDFAWDNYKADFISIGYSLSKDYWGQGIMTEAATAVLNYLREDYDIKGFTARTFYNNERSKNLLEKLGFKCVEKEEMEWDYELLL